MMIPAITYQGFALWGTGGISTIIKKIGKSSPHPYLTLKNVFCYFLRKAFPGFLTILKQLLLAPTQELKKHYFVLLIPPPQV